MENGHHLNRVESQHGKMCRDQMIKAALAKGFHLRCSDRSFVPHIQFRRSENERPYPYSLSLNRIDPVVYVRRPTRAQAESLLKDYAEAGAHRVQSTEIKIPLREIATANRLIAELF